jgi:hypothetical protein
MPITLRLFSICPRVRKRKGKLVACTALRLRILTLGALYREVVIDPRQQVVRLRRRYFWFWRRAERIPFALVTAVTYGYSGTGGAGDWWRGATDTKDAFSVGLRLDGLEEIHLFWFLGDGPFTNYGPLPDWLYWNEYLYDPRGMQETESRAYAEALSRLIGVPVTPPRI